MGVLQGHPTSAIAHMSDSAVSRKLDVLLQGPKWCFLGWRSRKTGLTWLPTSRKPLPSWVSGKETRVWMSLRALDYEECQADGRDGCVFVLSPEINSAWSVWARDTVNIVVSSKIETVNPRYPMCTGELFATGDSSIILLTVLRFEWLLANGQLSALKPSASVERLETVFVDWLNCEIAS